MCEEKSKIRIILEDLVEKVIDGSGDICNHTAYEEEIQQAEKEIADDKEISQKAGSD